MIKIGFWGATIAQEHIEHTWNADERRIVLHYLECTGAHSIKRYRGCSWCRVCKCSNGNGEQNDGVYLWPSGYAHYVRDHGLKPPQDFVDHVLARAKLTYTKE